MIRNKPPERNLQGWVGFFLIGASVVATGTFSHNFMGRWNGANIRLAGWLMFALGAYGIYLYFRNLSAEVSQNALRTVIFLMALTGGTATPFVCLKYNIKARPIYWIIPVMIIGHYLHKTLTRKCGQQTDTADSQARG